MMTVSVVPESGGRWAVQLPGGSRYTFPTKKKAKAIADAFCTICGGRANSREARQTALRLLEENQMGALIFVRRPRSIGYSAH
jgi:hypothetical protein